MTMTADKYIILELFRSNM